MKKQNHKKILRQIAKKYGVSVKEVAQEIDFALSQAQASPDPIVQANWASIPHKGERPTTAEAIVYAANMVKKRL